MEDDFPFSAYISALNQLPPANDDNALYDSNMYPSSYPHDLRYLSPSSPFLGSTQPLATSYTDAALQNELNLWTNAQFKFDIPLMSEGGDLNVTKRSDGVVESKLADVYLNLQGSPVSYTNGETSLSSIPPMPIAATSQARIPVDPTRKRTRSLNGNITNSALFPGNNSTSLIPNIPYNSISTHNFTNTNGQSYLFKGAEIPAADAPPPLSHLFGAYPAAVTSDACASELLDRINTIPATYIPSQEYTTSDELAKKRTVPPLQTTVTANALARGNLTAPGATTNETESTGLMEQEVTLEAHEDKRRRNTAASARFRVKKKQREQALERTAKEMSERVKTLESQVAELTMENKWLRGLVVDKDPRLMKTVDALKEKAKAANSNMSSMPTDSDSGSPSRSPSLEPATLVRPNKSSASIEQRSLPPQPPAKQHTLHSLSTSQTLPFSSHSAYAHSPAIPRAKRSKTRVSA